MSTKVFEVVIVPSLTFTVIVAVPLALAAGVTVSVRSALLPPSTSPAWVTNAALLLVAVTLREPAAVSTSPTVNDSTGVLASSLIAWSLIALRVGTSLTAVTVTEAAAVAALKAVLPPTWPEVSIVPLAPSERSHARKTSPEGTVPLKLALGSKRTNASKLSSRREASERLPTGSQSFEPASR